MKKAKIIAILLVLGMILTSVATLIASTSANAQGSLSEGTLTQAQIDKYKITNTSEGNQLGQAAVARWKQEGYCSTCQGNQSVEVYKFAEGDYLIVPSSTMVEFKYTRLKDKSIRIDPWIYVGTENNTEITTNTLNALTGAPYWAPTPGYPRCFTRIQNAGGWIDHCATIQKVYNDTDTTKDYYALQHYATGCSNGIWALYTMTLSCVKASGSSPMQWVDWSPKADLRVGNCQTYTLGVQAYGLLLSMSGELCDMWDITKYATPGKFQNVWRGKAWGSERHDQYEVAVSVPQNGNAGWIVSASFTFGLP